MISLVSVFWGNPLRQDARPIRLLTPLVLAAALGAGACQRATLPLMAAAPDRSPVAARNPAVFTPVPDAARAPVFSARVQMLLRQMTLEEKIGQMTQLTNSTVNASGRPAEIVLDSAKLVPLIRDFHVGSFLNGEAVAPAQWVKFTGTLQRIALRTSRLRIPVIYGIDHMHGASYVAGAAIFPHNLSLAATFDPEFARQEARATVMESADLGHPWVFAPVLDLGVNPYWSRLYETYGEDPLLAARMGTAFVKELQTNSDILPYKVAACGKHFLGYSDPRTGWDRTNAVISEQHLQEFFRPSFQAAIDAGLKSIMVNSGPINGIPVHASRALLTDLLRGQMGFTGVVVTDWEDIIRLVRVHRAAATEKEATLLALNAGIDMAMTPYTTDFCRYAKELVREGRLSEERLTLSAGRVLQLKDDLGLFENPLPRTDRLARIGAPEFRQQALAAAREAVVLLKNKQNSLPLKATTKRLLVVGPAANSRANLAGGWTLSWPGRAEARYPKSIVTLYQGLRQQFPNAQVELVSYRDSAGHLFLPRVAAAARRADAVVLALGEKPYAEGLGNINDLSLPDDQLQLVRTVQATGKPNVLVMLAGRPLIIRAIAEKASAILWAGLPGFEGGQALAEVISGRVNPSGKLPITYPQHAGHTVPYHHDPSENSLELAADVGADFGALKGKQARSAMLTDFGQGMSYTSFRYDNLRLSDSLLTGPAGRLQATVRVTNTGARAGREAVLWFLTDEVGLQARPVRQLRHFDKQALAPGQSRDFTFDVVPGQHLSYPDAAGRPQLEAGYFTLRVGDLKIRFRYQDAAVGATTPSGSTPVTRAGQ
ncbi:MAG TPA: glycoside hydrolase family 3 N-terminal domain-containing protein [Hymenobacter sp.]|jgi:beta-glucosidase